MAPYKEKDNFVFNAYQYTDKGIFIPVSDEQFVMLVYIKIFTLFYNLPYGEDLLDKNARSTPMKDMNDPANISLLEELAETNLRRIANHEAVKKENLVFKNGFNPIILANAYLTAGIPGVLVSSVNLNRGSVAIYYRTDISNGVQIGAKSVVEDIKLIYDLSIKK
jgi:hypothetical protein